MNSKEKINLLHYKELIEKRKFDEYDIIGFLILIRRHLDKNITPFICDFADGVAHRERDRGVAYNNIHNAYGNKFKINPDGTVKDFYGISNTAWGEELDDIALRFNIKITSIVQSEILLCIISLFQDTLFIDKKNQNFNGRHEIIICDNGKLHFCLANHFFICYAKLENAVAETKYRNKNLEKPVETFRKKGILYLKDEDGIILKVSKKH